MFSFHDVCFTRTLNYFVHSEESLQTLYEVLQMRRHGDVRITIHPFVK
jgi:hypothetical protein